MRKLRDVVSGLAIAGSVLIGAASSASAGDGRYDWGGVYAGINAGYAWSDVNWDYVNPIAGQASTGS